MEVIPDRILVKTEDSASMVDHILSQANHEHLFQQPHLPMSQYGNNTFNMRSAYKPGYILFRGTYYPLPGRSHGQ
jgi:hypothetical protein